MTLTPPLALAVAGLAAASLIIFVWGFALARTQQPMPADLGATTETARRPQRRAPSGGPLTAFADLLGRPLAPFVLQILGANQTAKLRRRINSAGRPNGITVDVYARRKGGYLLIFGGLGTVLALGGTTIALLLIVVGWFWVDLVLRSASRARQAQIERTLPDFLDVLTVTVSAGLGFRSALERVCESMPGALAEEFTTALRQMDVGTSRREAFENMRARNGCEQLSQFITAFLQAEELGAPLGQALTEISNDMRRQAAQTARRKAAKATPKATGVMTMLMTPGVLLLLIGALYFSQRGAFSGILG